MNKRFQFVWPHVRWPWWFKVFILGKVPKLRWPPLSSFYRWK